jgi:hypothetical protein
MTENEALRAQLEQARFDKAEYIAAAEAAAAILGERFRELEAQLAVAREALAKVSRNECHPAGFTCASCIAREALKKIGGA